MGNSIKSSPKDSTVKIIINMPRTFVTRKTKDILITETMTTFVSLLSRGRCSFLLLVSVAVVRVIGPGVGVPAVQRWRPSAPGVVGVAELGGSRSGWSCVADQIGDW